MNMNMEQATYYQQQTQMDIKQNTSMMNMEEQ